MEGTLASESVGKVLRSLCVKFCCAIAGVTAANATANAARPSIRIDASSARKRVKLGRLPAGLPKGLRGDR